MSNTIDPITIKQFSEGSIDYMDYGDTHKYTFTCSMVGTCAPLFDGMDSNHDVADALKKAKVITPAMQEDSEMCQFFVYFKTRAAGKAFVRRLNKYLVKRAGELDALGLPYRKPAPRPAHTPFHQNPYW